MQKLFQVFWNALGNVLSSSAFKQYSPIHWILAVFHIFFSAYSVRLHRFSVGCIWVTFSNPLKLYFRSLSLDIDVEKSDGEEASSAAATLAQLGPNLHKLWSYSCNLTKGRNVSCLAWNKLNPVSSHLLKREMKDLSHSENSNLSRGHFSGSAIY